MKPIVQSVTYQLYAKFHDYKYLTNMFDSGALLTDHQVAVVVNDINLLQSNFPNITIDEPSPMAGDRHSDLEDFEAFCGTLSTVNGHTDGDYYDEDFSAYVTEFDDYDTADADVDDNGENQTILLGNSPTDSLHHLLDGSFSNMSLYDDDNPT